MPDDRTHRWRNSRHLGGTFFVTTTTLDRAHRFLTDAAKDTIARSLLQTALALDARLTHYVVLSNHLHLLVHLPDTLTVSDFMRTAKVDAHARFGFGASARGGPRSSTSTTIRRSTASLSGSRTTAGPAPTLSRRGATTSPTRSTCAGR